MSKKTKAAPLQKDRMMIGSTNFLRKPKKAATPSLLEAAKIALDALLDEYPPSTYGDYPAIAKLTAAIAAHEAAAQKPRSPSIVGLALMCPYCLDADGTHQSDCDRPGRAGSPKETPSMSNPDCPKCGKMLAKHSGTNGPTYYKCMACGHKPKGCPCGNLNVVPRKRRLFCEKCRKP